MARVLNFKNDLNTSMSKHIKIMQICLLKHLQFEKNMLKNNFIKCWKVGTCIFSRKKQSDIGLSDFYKLLLIFRGMDALRLMTHNHWKHILQRIWQKKLSLTPQSIWLAQIWPNICLHRHFSMCSNRLYRSISGSRLKEMFLNSFSVPFNYSRTSTL